MGAGLWSTWGLVRGVRGLGPARRRPLGDTAAMAWLVLPVRAGALALTGLGLAAAARGVGADGTLVRNDHVLDAVGDALVLVGLLLAVAALFSDPPLALLALSSGESVLMATVTQQLLTRLAIAGALGEAGIVLNEAAGSEGGGPGGSSGSGDPPAGSTDRYTRPSRSPDPNASPRGRPTSPRPGDDRATVDGLARENESARTLARAGYDVEQNPQVPGTKNPDYRIEGKIFDNYAPRGDRARNIASNIDEEKVATGQADRIVLNLDDSNVTLSAMRDQLTRWPIKGLKEVIAIRNGVITHIFP